ncbi:MAG: queuosine precursor transporter [archaeon]|nr:queuosine precursor transporter [archaeon]
MKRNDFNLMAMAAIFVTALVTSNMLAAKVVQLGPFQVPASVVAYPVTFLVTDVIGEMWGKKPAQNVVYVGIVCQVLSLTMIQIAIYLPPASFMVDVDPEFRDILGSTSRVVFASLVGFVCSQSCDVVVFHRLRNAHLGMKWLRNNVSTFASQSVDSVLFILIAFGGTGVDIPVMVGSQIAVKWLIALCDTPVFYLLTRGSLSYPEKC